MKKLFVFLVISTLVLFSGQVSAVEKTPVKFLALSILSGKIGAIHETAWGYIDAMNYINEHGGINGRKVEIILEDFQYDTALALSIYNRIVPAHPEVLFILGNSTSVLLANAEQVKEDRIVCIDGAVSPSIFGPKGGKEKYPFYFSTSPPAGEQLSFTWQYIKDNLHKGKGRPKVAYVYMDMATGHDTLPDLRSTAKQYGMDIVLEEPVALTATDYSSVVMKIRQSKADYVFPYFSSVPMGTRLLKAAKNYIPDKKILGVNYFGWEIFFQTAGKAYDGAYAVSQFPKRTETDNKLVKIMNQAIKKKGREIKIWDFYVECWVKTLLGAEAARRADNAGDLTRKGILRALNNMTGWPAYGIFGGKLLDITNHHISYSRMLKADFKTKTLVPVTGWERLNEYLK